VLRVLKVFRVQEDHKDSREYKVLKDSKVQLEHKVL
jgi:hypothetical protein